MKIRVTENQVMLKNVYKEGNIERVDQYHHPLRSWDLEIPIDSMEEGWRRIKGDIRELIHLASNTIRR